MSRTIRLAVHLAALPAFAIALGFAAPALAQSAASADAAEMGEAFGGDTITIAGAAANIPDYEGSNDNRWTAAPFAIGSVGGFAFSVLGNRASIDLIPDQDSASGIDLQLGPIAAINFNRQDADSIDDARVRALGEVKTGIEVGGYVGIGKTGVITSPYDKLQLSLSYRHDVNNAHDSAIWQPTINYLTPLSTKAAVAFFASAEHAGQGYATTYFSVNPAQSVASTLPVFNAEKGWKNYSLGGVFTYALTGNLLHGFKVLAGGNYRRMLNDFADSPLTSIAGSKSQWMGAVGIGYTF